MRADPTLPEAEALASCDPIVRWSLATFYPGLRKNRPELWEDALQAGRLGALLAIRSWNGRSSFMYWVRQKIWAEIAGVIRPDRRLQLQSYDAIRIQFQTGSGETIDRRPDYIEQFFGPKPEAVYSTEYWCLNCQKKPTQAAQRAKAWGSGQFCPTCDRRRLRQAKAFGDKGACPTCGKIYRSFSPSRRRPCETGCDA